MRWRGRGSSSLIRGEGKLTLAAVFGLSLPVATHPLGTGRDGGELLDGGALALGPFVDSLAGDHPEADKRPPDPLDLVDNEVETGGDNAQIDPG